MLQKIEKEEVDNTYTSTPKLDHDTTLPPGPLQQIQ